MGTYFQAIGEANAKVLEELYIRRKKGVILTEKLDAYFHEKYGPQFIAQGEARGVAIGEARGRRNTVLAVLRARFKKVPRGVKKAILGISDSIALESWVAQATTSIHGRIRRSVKVNTNKRMRIQFWDYT